MELLKLDHVGKVYEGSVPQTALTDITLTVDRGDFVGIMGPSGSGKTTLLNLISTIDRPTSGELTVNGKRPHSLSRNELARFRRTELGFVFQDFNLLHTLTVEENIVLPLTLEGVKVPIMEAKVRTIAERLGILPILKKRIYEISGGQAQRVAIARAVIHSPSLLLADEPTGNLDSKASKDVMTTLADINAREGTTTLLVTHDALAASYCRRVIFIKDGRLYNELHRGDNRQAFFQRIIDMLSLLGGHAHDLASVRV